MKVLKVVIFLGIIIYWATSMNDEIKGDSVFVSLLGIVVLGAFIYGAYYLLFK